MDEEAREQEYQYTRETIEDMFQNQYDYQGSQEVKNYQPVLYEVIKDPAHL